VICIVYLNDILIYSRAEEGHERNTCAALDHLPQFQLCRSLKEYEFDVLKVEFLSFVVSIESVAMDESTVSAIRDWLIPTTLREV